MSTVCRCASVMWVGVLWFCGGVLAEEAKIVTIVSEKTVGQWIVDEASGRIFASLPEDDAVVEYDSATGKEVRRFEVVGSPKELMIKRGWLVAGCTKTIALSVVDLKANKVVGKIQLAGKGPYALFCSRADNPYAYAICNTGDAWWDGEVFQVDLTKQSVKKRVKVQGWRQSHPVHVVMSRDGCFISPDARGQSSPSGGTLMSADEESCTFKDIVHHHNSFGPVAAGPSSRWWTLGNLLYPADFRGSVRTFGGSPVAIHPSLDLAASVKGKEILLETFSEAKPIASIALPDGKVSSQKPSSSGKTPSRLPSRSNFDLQGEARIQFDLARGRVVCCIGSTAYVASLTDTGKQFTPRLEILGPMQVRVAVGETQRTKFDTESIPGGKKVAWKVESGPDFAKLDANELILSPNPADIGEHAIDIQATAGDISDTIKVAVTVGLPSVDLGFAGAHLEIDRAGKYAVAWNQVGAPTHPSDQEAAGTGPQFVIVNLETLKITKSQRLTGGIQAMAIDDKYVYMAQPQATVLYRLDRDDFTKRSRFVLNSVCRSLVLTPDGQLAAVTGEMHGPSVQIVDPKTFTSNPNHFANRQSIPQFRRQPDLWSPLGDGLLKFCESILDAQTGRLVCLAEPGPLPTLLESVQRNRGSTEDSMKRWGRYFLPTSLRNSAGAQVAAFQHPAVASAEHPLIGAIRADRSGQRGKAYLDLRDMKAGEIIRTMDLGAAPPENVYSQQYGVSTMIFLKDRILLPQGSRLSVCPLDGKTLKSLPVPLRVKYPKLAPVPVNKPLEITFACVGAEGAPTWSLAGERAEVTIDARTGKVTVDLPLLWKKYLATSEQQVRAGAASRQDGAGKVDPKKFLESVMGESLPAGTVPFGVPLSVSVSDASGDGDEINVVLVALAPQADVDKARADSEAKRAEQQAAMRAQQEAAQQEALRRRKEAEAKAAGAETPDELSARIRRLEAALDAVLLRLEKLEKSASKPEFEPADRNSKAAPAAKKAREKAFGGTGEEP